MKLKFTILSYCRDKLLSPLKAQCLSNEAEVYFEIYVSNWAYEVSYQLLDDNNNLVFSGQLAGTSDFDSISACVPSGECLQLILNDTYGDGINQAADYYLMVLDGDTIISEADFNFGHDEVYSFNCPPGSTCFDPLVADTAIWYEGQFDDSWYAFTPGETGMYEITTCDSNTCNTQIWMFEDCTGNPYTEDESGSFIFNDDNPNCSPQSTASTALLAGVTYLIRIGDFQDDCPGTIKWTITYQGPVVGCMDPNACNYNPLATVSGNCIQYGDPACPNGPDLIIDQARILSSIYLSTIYMNPNNNYDLCQVQEGCTRGMGDRTIVRFDTRIANIGQEDYYIGTPGANPGQFDFNNCHGHTHYKGYAEYLLYDANGDVVPVGFKAGFCVMDIDCNGGGTGGYNCGNMGISHGCADVYGSGTTCNWIDITDVDTGDYTFVVRTNWDFSPDALGRYETDHLNNWAQVCIHIGEDVNGNKNFAINPNCATYTDCNGTPYGPAQNDCTGTCGGSTLTGDLNLDGVQNLGDANLYVNEILSESISPVVCNDLNDDGEITVFDACLLQDCWYGEFDNNHTHGADALLNHCNYPYGFTNLGDTVWLKILSYDLTNKTIDIGMRNPYNKVLAYEFDMEGVSITTVDNLVPASIYPITPENALGGTKVIGMSFQDSLIPKNFAYFPLARINYNSLTDTTVCIADIIDIVSGNYEAVVTIIEDGCFTIPQVEDTIVMDQIGSWSADSNAYVICGYGDAVPLSANYSGGYFFGDGVIANEFFADLAGPGEHELFYYYPGVLPVSIWVTVLNADIITLAEDSISMFITDPTIDLLANPAGCVYSGPGMFGNTFNPSNAGLGTHEILCTYTLANGCVDTKSIYITVDASVAIRDLNNTLQLEVLPNPFNDFTIIRFDNANKSNYSLKIINAVGQVVREYSQIKTGELVVEKGNLSNGIYTFILEGEYEQIGKFVIY
ncbi:MAG: lysyl oxidase family protein [Chitinophagales bacterium]